MTRLLNQGQGELLRLLARIPFLDRLELAALAGRSRGGAYQAVGRLEDAGLIASVAPQHRTLLRSHPAGTTSPNGA